MFQVKPEHVRRVVFASKLFPKINSSISLDTHRIKGSSQFDGEVFCGGRSKNRDLLTFFGFINDPKNSSGFIQLPTFRRSLKKLTNIVEHELERIGAQEVLMPTLVPQKLWHMSGRLDRQKNALENVYRFTDDSGNKLLLGPTFEETITRLVAEMSETVREHDMPLMLYQTSNKFRFETNPRFGLIRSNEFCMNDLYTFDTNSEKAAQTYDLVSESYEKIFKKLGLNCMKIESNTGNIGGRYSHEYQLRVSSGEDTIVECQDCHQAYNAEMDQESSTSGSACIKCGGHSLKMTKSIELGHTFLLSDTYSRPLKARIAISSGDKVDLEMGCYGLGLSRILAAAIDLQSIVPNDDKEDLQLRWPSGAEPFGLGIVAPAKRSKQHQAGSTDFIERIVCRTLDTNRKVDIIVEDRDKESLVRRLVKLMSLGLPNIVVVGQKFLLDEPQVEFLSLNSEKTSYDRNWFTEDQLHDYIGRIDD